MQVKILGTSIIQMVQTKPLRLSIQIQNLGTSLNKSYLALRLPSSSRARIKSFFSKKMPLCHLPCVYGG